MPKIQELSGAMPPGLSPGSTPGQRDPVGCPQTAGLEGPPQTLPYWIIWPREKLFILFESINFAKK